MGFWGPLAVEMWADMDPDGDPFKSAVQARKLMDHLITTAWGNLREMMDRKRGNMGEVTLDVSSFCGEQILDPEILVRQTATAEACLDAGADVRDALF